MGGPSSPLPALGSPSAEEALLEAAILVKNRARRSLGHRQHGGASMLTSSDDLSSPPVRSPPSAGGGSQLSPPQRASHPAPQSSPAPPPAPQNSTATCPPTTTAATASAAGTAAGSLVGLSIEELRRVAQGLGVVSPIAIEAASYARRSMIGLIQTAQDKQARDL